MQINGKSLILMAASLLMAACVEEKIEGPKSGDAFEVSFVIGGDGAQTKAGIAANATVAEPIDLSEETGIQGLQLTDEVTSMDELYAPMTKGTPVYTENLEKMYPTLAVTAYSNGGIYGRRDVEYNYKETTTDGKIYSHNYSEGTADGNLAWPEDGSDLLFFIKGANDGCGITSGPTYAYKENKAVSGEGDVLGYGTIKFNYTTPGVNNTTDAAEKQTDILFSTKKLAKGTQDSENNKVLLYHALTAVKFKAKTNSSVSDVQIKSITSVKFENVLSQGSCVITPNYEGYGQPSNKETADRDKSAVVSVWSDRTGKATFGQEFDGKISFDSSANTNNFAASFYDGTTAVDNLNDATCSQTFMFMPQALGDDITLTVTFKYTIGSDTTEKTGVSSIDFGQKLKKSNAGVYEWKAGELHTYALTIGDGVNVDITDKVDTETTKKKSDLVIKNTGTATAYMRVAVVGNWYTDEESIDPSKNPVAITPCPELAAKVDAAVAAYGSNWFKVGDYYYYKYQVDGGVTIKPENTLFGTLDLSSLTRPYTSCHLEVTVAVQAVRAIQVADAWPLAAAENKFISKTND